MNIVHGFLGGFPPFGVRKPVLPFTSVGLFNSSPPSAPGAEPDGSGSTGVELALRASVLAPAATSPDPFCCSVFCSRSAAFSLSFRSFFSFFLALSFSALSGALLAPLALLALAAAVGLSFGVPGPVPAGEPPTRGGVAAVDLLVLLRRWGGKGLSESGKDLSGIGVDPFVGGRLVLALLCDGGRGDVVELGVGVVVAVRRYA